MMHGTWEQKMLQLARVLEAHDGVGAQSLALAKDYLIEASYKLNSLRPIHDCASCRYFRLTDCQLAGKMPPPEILKAGCEQWEDSFDLPF